MDKGGFYTIILTMGLVDVSIRIYARALINPYLSTPTEAGPAPTEIKSGDTSTDTRPRLRYRTTMQVSIINCKRKLFIAISNSIN